jgi:hypothetical protein
MTRVNGRPGPCAMATLALKTAILANRQIRITFTPSLRRMTPKICDASGRLEAPAQCEVYLSRSPRLKCRRQAAARATRAEQTAGS